MKRKTQRLWLLTLTMLCLGGAAWFVLETFRDNLVFFYTPSDLTRKKVPLHQKVRLGGYVADKSVMRSPQSSRVQFQITDGERLIQVTYEGILPDLFREGQGVVAEGKLIASDTFEATTILAKHDENYVPPALKNLKYKGPKAS